MGGRVRFAEFWNRIWLAATPLRHPSPATGRRWVEAKHNCPKNRSSDFARADPQWLQMRRMMDDVLVSCHGVP